MQLLKIVAFQKQIFPLISICSYILKYNTLKKIIEMHNDHKNLDIERAKYSDWN